MHDVIQRFTEKYHIYPSLRTTRDNIFLVTVHWQPQSVHQLNLVRNDIGPRLVQYCVDCGYHYSIHTLDPQAAKLEPRHPFCFILQACLQVS